MPPRPRSHRRRRRRGGRRHGRRRRRRGESSLHRVRSAHPPNRRGGGIPRLFSFGGARAGAAVGAGERGGAFRHSKGEGEHVRRAAGQCGGGDVRDEEGGGVGRERGGRFSRRGGGGRSHGARYGQTGQSGAPHVRAVLRGWHVQPRLGGGVRSEGGGQSRRDFESTAGRCLRRRRRRRLRRGAGHAELRPRRGVDPDPLQSLSNQIPRIDRRGARPRLERHRRRPRRGETTRRLQIGPLPTAPRRRPGGRRRHRSTPRRAAPSGRRGRRRRGLVGVAVVFRHRGFRGQGLRRQGRRAHSEMRRRRGRNATIPIAASIVAGRNEWCGRCRRQPRQPQRRRPPHARTKNSLPKLSPRPHRRIHLGALLILPLQTFQCRQIHHDSFEKGFGGERHGEEFLVAPLRGVCSWIFECRDDQ
mmetsp:Transcript_23355/g.48442  ORF Transcript_23355/g.48442 Transcript_23355/m.48442 type:complete len:416 (-) Transcript_23355:550-1797(-)